ncbi:MAG: FIST C-terminal domain-containing protein [Ruminococcus sp.]|jgi:hypothetical protein|nr:FIST C-terminal domain-containing protein [Ruminococcus sp.]
MKVVTAHTTEIDNVKAAAEDIKNQLGEIDTYPEENTFGFLSCHFEFVRSGAAEAIIKALPFPVFGATSSLMGTNNACGELILTLTVVSGEEIEKVEITATPPVKDNTDLDALIAPIFGDTDKKPALVWVCAPDFVLINGDMLCESYNKIGYGVPLFGMYAVDDSPLFNEECYVFTKDLISRDRVVFMKIYGDIKPFTAAISIPRAKILPRVGMVTKSDKNTVYEIDGKPASEFLGKFGLAEQLEISGAISALSLIVNNKNETHYHSRTLLGINPDGSALTGGSVKTGSEIRIGLFDRDGMLEAASDMLQNALDKTHISVMFICCCATRSVALGCQDMDEINLAGELSDRVPFALSYAGGEIAPHGSDNAFFHNQSFCICAF